MTKIDEYEEILFPIKIHPWERPCFWCGDIFSVKNQRGRAPNWRRLDNTEHETKWFCSRKHKMDYIYAKQKLGVFLP